MKRFLASLVFLTAMLAIGGCAHKEVTQAPQQPETVAPAPAPTPGEAKVTEEKKVPEVSEAVEKQPEKELATTVQDVHFDFDKSDIKDDAKPILKRLSEILSSNITTRLTIEGNCDERGTSEYNLALGDRRANAAKTYLVSLGIPSGRIKTISYGKEKPLCTESSEECWAKNRRDHFVFTEASR